MKILNTIRGEYAEYIYIYIYYIICICIYGNVPGLRLMTFYDHTYNLPARFSESWIILAFLKKFT